MIENKRIKTKRIWCSIIVVIAILVLLYIKNDYSEILLRHNTYGMPALIEKGHIDNLFIGSSAFRQGISIDVLDGNLSGENYILAYNGNEPYLELIELNKLIGNDVNTGHIYIDMYAYGADRAPQLDDEKLLLELNLNEKIKLYSMLDGHSISKCWQLFVTSNNDMLLTWPINKGLINSRFRNGGTLIYSAGLDESSYDNIIAPNADEKLNSIQAESIIGIIDICRQNNIEVTFVETPKASNIMRNQDYLNLMDQYTEILDANDVEVIKADISEMMCSDYSDGIHLSSDGRVKYTEWLMDKIQSNNY